MKNNKELIEYIQEEQDRGESSLDTIMKVYSVLNESNPELINEFQTAYEEYADSDEPMSRELLKRVYAALADSPEYASPDRGISFDDLH